MRFVVDAAQRLLRERDLLAARRSENLVEEELEMRRRRLPPKRNRGAKR